MEKERDKRKVVLLLNITLLKVLLIFLIPFLKVVFGVYSTSSITIFIYSIAIIYSLYVIFKTKGFNSKNIIRYLFVLLFFVFNYLIFSKYNSYYLTLEMILNYFLYIPISVFIVLTIKDYSSLFDVANKYIIISILFVLGVFAFNLTSNLEYMDFSYSILPFAVLASINAGNKMKIIPVLEMAFFAFIVAIFGARSPLLFILASFICTIIVKKRSIRKIVFSVAVCLVVLLFLFVEPLQNSLFSVINKYSNGSSYILSRLINGSFFESSGRDVLYDAAKDYINNMGLGIGGLFADRTLSLSFNQPYIHSFLYEILIDFGWVFGISALFVFAFVSIRCFFVAKDYRNVLIFAFFGYFARYFVSGSVFVEGKSYLFIAMLFSVYTIAMNKYKHKNKLGK